MVVEAKNEQDRKWADEKVYFFQQKEQKNNIQAKGRFDESHFQTKSIKKPQRLKMKVNWI